MLLNEMKKTSCLAVVVLSVAAGLSSAVLIDDFEGYATGDVKTVANPPWHEVNTGTGYADIESADGNQYLTYGWFSATGDYVRGAYFDITPVSDASTAVTLFARVYAEPGDINHSFGLSDDAVPGTSMGHFEVQIVGANGTTGSEFLLKGNDAGTFITYATLSRETWYNVWAVVNQSTDTFDLYVTGGDASATAANKVATGVHFRNGTTGDLVTFFAGAWDAAQNFRVDDVYLSTGVSLLNPTMNLTVAHNPSPADGAVGVTNGTALSWETALDPNAIEQLYPGITHHYLYLKESNADFSSGAATVQIAVNGATGSYTPTIQPDRTYYWRVDEILNNGSPTDPNFVIEGLVWSFESWRSAPEITADPADVIVAEDDDAVFTVSLSSYSPATAAWFKYVDGINDTPCTNTTKYEVDTDGTTYAALTVKNAAGSDEGYYYCLLSSSGGSDTSAQAALAIKQLKAYWSLDGLVGGQYEDSSGGNHHADPNGTPVFGDGANPAVTDQAVQIQPGDGFAAAGTWNPSDVSNQLTISLWARWAGHTNPAAYQGVLAKRNAWGNDNMMWQLEIDPATGSLAYKNGSNNTAGTGGSLPVGEWTHVVVTVEGDSVVTYRNGLQAGSASVPFSAKTDANVVIGAVELNDAGTFSSIFNGALDDIHIYNYALSHTEVVDLFHTVTGQSVCIVSYSSAYDYDHNCIVDLADFALLAAKWLDCGLYPECDMN
jgi:hypothetical protein